MAIGDLATATADTTGTSLTYAHSVAGSTDLAIWVAVDDWRNTGFVDPSGITYAGAALTKLGGNFAGGTDNKNMVSAWRRTAPATGSNNVVVTHAQSHDITAVSASYSGVDQTTPEDTPSGNDTTSATPSHAITSATGDLVLGWVMAWNITGFTFTGGTGTERLENNNTNGVNSVAFADAPGAASVTMSWSVDGGSAEPHGQISLNINAAGGGGAATSRPVFRRPWRVWRPK